MNLNIDYRTRCYESYFSQHWQYDHEDSQETYDRCAKVNKIQYNKFLPQNKEAKILDIACGAGHFLYFLQKTGYLNSSGIDISKEMLEHASKMGVKNIQHADLFKYLTAYNQHFDLIIANDIIEHLNKNEVLRLLDLIYSSLDPEGCVLITCPNAQSLFGNSARFCCFTHEQAFTPTSMSQVMRICNFREVQIIGLKPIAYDLRSSIRLMLWLCIQKLLKAYLIIERGTGRGCDLDRTVEYRLLVVGKKRPE